MSEHATENRPRKSLRESVCEIDRDILRLLMRRHNLLRRMHTAKGHLDPAEEKFLREAWEAAASRVSRDPRLSSRFFTLMQEVAFLPRPEDEPADKRPAFNLAPATAPVDLAMRAPLACRDARAWLYLAAASGRSLRLEPCLMNDPLVDCVKMLNQLGAAITRENEGVNAMPAAPLAALDKVVHVGCSAWNFYLALGHYLGRPSRAKFVGDPDLRLADFSVARRFAGQMGARLIQAVPKSDGLPVRLECSGVLPDTVRLPADAPTELAEAILLAAPCYAQPLRLDLADMAARAVVFARTLPILEQAGADVRREADTIRVTPGLSALPERPSLPLEAELALLLLGLAPSLGGTVRLEGRWPQTPAARAGWEFLQGLGGDLRREEGETPAVRLSLNAPLVIPAAGLALPPDFPAEWLPLPLALLAQTALRQGSAPLPSALREGCSDEFRADMTSFCTALHLCVEDGVLRPLREEEQSAPSGRGWNAPDPVWALALALAACARDKRQVRLGNPGIITGLYPAFWTLYNGLPAPKMERAPAPAAPALKARRRIITNVLADIPDLPDED